MISAHPLMLPEIGMKFIHRVGTFAGWVVVAMALLGFGDTLGQDDYMVRRFRIHGAKQINKKALREVLATQARPWSHRFLFWKENPLFDGGEFELDLLRIVKFYRLEGFTEARIDSHRVVADDRKQRVDVEVYVHEGRPLLVDRVEIVADDTALVRQRFWNRLPRRLVLQPRRRWREPDSRLDAARIAERLSDSGYPYARVAAVEQVDSVAFKINVQFRVTPGPACVFGDVQINGLQQVPRQVVSRELNIVPGRRFDQSKLAEAQQLIYRLELFQFVSVRASDFENRSTSIPVEVKVREAPYNTLKIGLGYGTEDKFRASANGRRRNFFGGGRRFEYTLKHSGLQPVRLEASLIQPHFFDRRNIAVFNPFFVRDDEINFRINRLGANVSAQRHFARSTDGFLNYRFESDRIDAPTALRAVDRSLADSLQSKRNKSIGTLGIIRNDSRPLFNPIQGALSSITLEYSGNAFRSRFPYWKVTVERRGYVGLEPGWVFAYRAAAGSMAPVKPAVVTPIEERFYVGGSSSVRGWQRFQLGPKSADGQPLGGNSMFEGSGELRFPIYRVLGGAVFLDAGSVWPKANTFVWRELHYAAGAGLRLATPIGPIRLDLGAKLNKQRAAENTLEFHLSVGQSF